MRNIFIILFLLFCFLYSNIYSQLILTSAYNPAAGDMARYFYCDTTGIVPGDSGINKNWNFGNLQVNDSSIANYVDPQNTPYFSLFPTANVASFNGIQPSNVYSYYETSSDFYAYLGYAYPGFQEILANTEYLMQYPFTYNSTYSDNYSGSGMLSGFSFSVTGTIDKIADATGTISLPFGTYSNALRIKSIQTETDSAAGIQYVIKISSVEYSWYVDLFKFPVLTIYNYVNIDNGDTTIGKEVYYCNSQLIGITKNSNSLPVSFKLFQNYPNPFNPVTKIRFAIPPLRGVRGMTKIIIYDVLGREVTSLVNQELTPGKYEVEFDASNYPSGVYFYRLITDGFSETRKMILLK
jgi:hypothetical protein